MSILFKETQTHYCKKQTKYPPTILNILYELLQNDLSGKQKSSRNVLAQDNQRVFSCSAEEE